MPMKKIRVPSSAGAPTKPQGAKSGLSVTKTSGRNVDAGATVRYRPTPYGK